MNQEYIYTKRDMEKAIEQARSEGAFGVVYGCVAFILLVVALFIVFILF